MKKISLAGSDVTTPAPTIWRLARYRTCTATPRKAALWSGNPFWNGSYPVSWQTRWNGASRVKTRAEKESSTDMW